ERRAQALSVDPARLRELLGEGELRELLDPDALALLERQLQHLTEERKARHADGLHDLLLRLGDLSDTEVAARVTAPEAAAGWLPGLAEDGRILAVTIGGESRFIAAEDVGRYRDALGIAPPSLASGSPPRCGEGEIAAERDWEEVGLPEAFLEPIRDA